MCVYIVLVLAKRNKPRTNPEPIPVSVASRKQGCLWSSKRNFVEYKSTSFPVCSPSSYFGAGGRSRIAASSVGPIPPSEFAMVYNPSQVESRFTHRQQREKRRTQNTELEKGSATSRASEEQKTGRERDKQSNHATLTSVLPRKASPPKTNRANVCLHITHTVQSTFNPQLLCNRQRNCTKLLHLKQS